MKDTTRNTASVYVPGHITGLFEICLARDFAHMGSRGSGFCIDKGVKTTVTVRPRANDAQPSVVHVFFDSRPTAAPVTRTVVHRLLADTPGTYEIWIRHEFDIPIGVGLGASGAGALGTAWGLAKALKLKKNPQELAQIAHIAEVENRTGLGDVIAQFHGGFEIRRKPGAPGIGEITVLDNVWARDVVCFCFGEEIETAKVLSDPRMAQRISRRGRQLLKELTVEFSLKVFCKLSQRFAKTTGLVTPQVTAMLQQAKRVGVELGSMSMLGNSVFLFVEEGQKILPQLRNGAKEVLVTRISRIGLNGMS
ncbi:MAG: pantoate kinase [Candidatus Hodarchaeota archaeon]